MTARVSRAERTLTLLGFTDLGGELWKPPVGPSSVPRLIERVVALETELETERMRLAACGVAAMCDTPESIALHVRPMLPAYRSASLDGVERQMATLVRLRAELAALHDASTTAVPVGQVEVTSVDGVIRHEFEPVLMLPPGTTPLYAMQFICPVTSWQPIATAPKQGQVLLRWPGRRSPCVGSWCPDSSARTPAPYWSGDTDRWIGVRETRTNQPTHWMPLPA